MKKTALLIAPLLLTGCLLSDSPPPGAENAEAEETLPGSPLASNEIQTGGIRMIPIHTPKGDFKVWTKTVGSNPRIKVLLLHGGPGCSHEYFEAFDSLVAPFGIEYIYYDQLGSYYSDQPDDP